MTAIIRTTNPEDGSTTIAAHIDVADLVKADRSAVDELEIAMRGALEFITGEKDHELPRIRRKQTVRNVAKALKAFVIFLVLVIVVVAMAGVVLFAIEKAWGLL